ncbi:type II toxin-antitoxin system RelE/ParE family toxin [Candidatus Micrarchaeota archaeon]|nr:type II toxin-antitoxin system RelE/ParE family toxin [Candidatus Micrarchaeota archaeon]
MKVILAKKPEKFMLELDEKRYNAILEVLRHLEINPVPYKDYDLIKISGTRNGYRIRKGKIRILYSIEKELESIFVEKIEWRDETTYK